MEVSQRMRCACVCCIYDLARKVAYGRSNQRGTEAKEEGEVIMERNN